VAGFKSCLPDRLRIGQKEGSAPVFPALKARFVREGRLDRLTLALFLVINALVLTNSVLHDPEIGYDAVDHLRYIRVLPQRLPTAQDTREFFSPPLPYFLPSLIDEACVAVTGQPVVLDESDDCLRAAGRSAQLLNVFLSLGVSLLFLGLADLVRPGSRLWKPSCLILLGILPVYYKTFAQVRGEPYVVFFTVWSLYLLARMLTERESVGRGAGVWLGVSLGLLGLSRQWGFMLWAALAAWMLLVWVVDRTDRRRVGNAVAVAFTIAAVLCGWFYVRLFAVHGSLTAFNRPARPFAFSNQPVSFYRNTGLKGLLLFRSPVRPTFDNQFFPTFYSDVWGDYWGYFVLIPDRASLKDERYQNNTDRMAPYLGRVNAVSVFPSLLFACALAGESFWLVRPRGAGGEIGRSLWGALLLTFVAASFLLYLYFLIRFTSVGPDSTNKAAYMLHVLVVLPLLGTEFLERVSERRPQAIVACMSALGLAWLHNLSAMVTQYRL
jgi:hypothetical protein